MQYLSALDCYLAIITIDSFEDVTPRIKSTTARHSQHEEEINIILWHSFYIKLFTASDSPFLGKI